MGLRNRFQSIGIKLFLGLFIPVIILGLYSWLSYTKSVNIIKQNYEVKVSDNLNAISDYLNLGLGMVEQSALELLTNSNVTTIFENNRSEDKVAMLKAYNDLETTIYSINTNNLFISSVYLFGINGKGLSSDIAIKNNLYQVFEESDLGKEFMESKMMGKWVGEHEILDKALSGKNEEYDISDYALSYIRTNAYKSVYTVMDISEERIMDLFSRYSLEKGSIMGFITEDGREILYGSKDNGLFKEIDFDKHKSGEYINYNRKEYLFAKSRLEGINAAVCALVPKDEILQKTDSMQLVNIICILTALVFSGFMAAFVTKSLAKEINLCCSSILKAARGDLTVKFHTRRKDEFRILSDGISEMMEGMRNLVGEVQEVGGKVNTSAADLSQTSEDLITTTRDIMKAIDDMEQGITGQADDTENCLKQMNALSDQINKVYQSTYHIEKSANNSIASATQGMKILDELNEKSKATYSITQNVIEKINEFELMSSTISDFVIIINNIAKKTKLLSLNASIEATQAGGEGNGFAVVASEIRKLAEESVKTVNHVQSIVSEIKKKTAETVSTAVAAKNIVESQTKSIDRTVHAFRDISDHVSGLVTNFKDILTGVQKMEVAKEDTLTAIENISAISEETAASAQEMNAVSINQMEAIKKLNKAALELARDADKLQNAINIFTI